MKKENTGSRKSSSYQKRKTEARVKNKVANKTSKGKMYCSSLPRGNNGSINEKSPTKEESNAPATDVNCNTTSAINVERFLKKKYQKTWMFWQKC